MTIQELRDKIERERQTLGKLDARRRRIEELQEKLQAEVRYYENQMLANHRAENDASMRLQAAEGDLNEAVARGIAEYHEGPSREELLDKLQRTLRSKLPFAYSVVRMLEIYTRYQGVGLTELGFVSAAVNPKYPNRYRTLTATQKARVMEVLMGCCPKHPDTGRYLPPYEVDESGIVQTPDVAPPVGLRAVPTGYNEPSCE